jgi:hypothetical protein
LSVNGLYADVQFNYDKSAFVQDINAFNGYFKKVGKHPVIVGKSLLQPVVIKKQVKAASTEIPKA